MLEPNLIDNFWNNVYRLNDSDCWLWLGYREFRGYGVLVHKHKRYKAHRLSWMIANDVDIPPNKLIMHTCDNRACVNPNHLKLGTQDDNMKDAKDKGRIIAPTGRNNGRSILTDNQVVEIIQSLKTGITIQKLAKNYNVTWGTIKAISLGKTWKHIDRGE